MRELILLGQTIDAHRALQLGLINRIGGIDDAIDLCDESCKAAPARLRGASVCSIHFRRATIEEDLKLALDFHLHARQSNEAAEGMAAFLEKRTPRWGPRPSE